MFNTKKNSIVKIGAISFGLVLVIGLGVVYLQYSASKRVAVATPVSTSTSAKTVGKLSFNGNSYEGDIKDGKANGQGTLTYANGNVYVGEFKDNKKEGQGTLTTSYNGTKAIYVGGFANNQKFGQGDITVTYPDGKVYKGDYKSLANSPGLFPPDTTPPNDGFYHPSSNNPAGFLVKAITFHEEFRPNGLKAVDVLLLARSNNGENVLVADRDRIVEIVGTSGKVYNMEGTKGTGVEINLQDGTYTEYSITQYKDVDASEQNIASVVLLRDGKRIEIKVEGVIPVVTHS